MRVPSVVPADTRRLPPQGSGVAEAVLHCQLHRAAAAEDEQSLSWLTGPERQRSAGFRSPAARARFVAGRGLARRVLGARLGCQPAAIVFEATCAGCGRDHGRPALPVSTLDFSLAHSGGTVLLAVIDRADGWAGSSVGVDVETHGAHDVASLARLVLTGDERRGLEARRPDQHEAFFLDHWTRKEAVVKAAGVGLLADLREVPTGHPGYSSRWRDGRLTTVVGLDLVPDPGGSRLSGAVCVLTPRPCRLVLTGDAD